MVLPATCSNLSTSQNCFLSSIRHSRRNNVSIFSDISSGHRSVSGDQKHNAHKRGRNYSRDTERSDDPPQIIPPASKTYLTFSPCGPTCLKPRIVNCSTTAAE